MRVCLAGDPGEKPVARLKSNSIDIQLVAPSLPDLEGTISSGQFDKIVVLPTLITQDSVSVIEGLLESRHYQTMIVFLNFLPMGVDLSHLEGYNKQGWIKVIDFSDQFRLQMIYDACVLELPKETILMPEPTINPLHMEISMDLNKGVKEVSTEIACLHISEATVIGVVSGTTRAGSTFLTNNLALSFGKLGHQVSVLSPNAELEAFVGKVEKLNGHVTKSNVVINDNVTWIPGWDHTHRGLKDFILSPLVLVDISTDLAVLQHCLPHLTKLVIVADALDSNSSANIKSLKDMTTSMNVEVHVLWNKLDSYSLAMMEDQCGENDILFELVNPALASKSAWNKKLLLELPESYGPLQDSFYGLAEEVLQ